MENNVATLISLIVQPHPATQNIHLFHGVRSIGVDDSPLENNVEASCYTCKISSFSSLHHLSTKKLNYLEKNISKNLGGSCFSEHTSISKNLVANFLQALK